MDSRQLALFVFVYADLAHFINHAAESRRGYVLVLNYLVALYQ